MYFLGLVEMVSLAWLVWTEIDVIKKHQCGMWVSSVMADAAALGSWGSSGDLGRLWGPGEALGTGRGSGDWAGL